MRVGLIVALLGLAAPALAQSDKDRARDLLRQGNAHVEAREWSKALESFQAAHRAFPSPKILINIGLTFLELDRPVEALESFERFLAEAGAGADADLVTRARAGATTAAGQIGEIHVDAPAGTDVALDNRPAGTVPTPRIRAKAGPHKVTLRVPGRESLDLLAEVKGGGHTTVRPPTEEMLAPTPVVAPAPAAPAPIAPAPAPLRAPPPTLAPPSIVATPIAPEPPPAEKPAFYRRWPFWTGVVVVATGAVAAGVLLSRAEPAGSATPDGDAVIDAR